MLGLEGQKDMSKKVECRRHSGNSMSERTEMQTVAGTLVEAKGKCWCVSGQDR